jgi:hypothetical protein
MFVFIGNDDKTVAPPGVYNIPLQGKNAYIQIEVGAYGWLISTSIREQLRISYQSGQTFDIANVPHFNTVGYDDRNASSLWISTIEQGKYTDQWSLVWPKRDNAGNLYFEYVGSNANMKFLAPGTYMCPMSNKQLFQILIGSSSGYAITYHGINAGDTYFNTQLDYDGLVKGNLIYDDNIHLTPPLDCTNGDRCYDANNIVPYSIDSSGTIHAGEATLTQGDYLVICPLDKYKIRGWVRVAQDGKIAELSPQPQTSSIPPPQVKILDSNPQISPPSPPPQVDLSQENPIPSPQTQNTPPQIPPSPSEQNTL